jgi:hypothetical protein
MDWTAGSGKWFGRAAPGPPSKDGAAKIKSLTAKDATEGKRNAEELQLESELLCVPFSFSASFAVKLLLFALCDTSRRSIQNASRKPIVGRTITGASNKSELRHSSDRVALNSSTRQTPDSSYQVRFVRPVTF